jgi:hypothetical protein
MFVNALPGLRDVRAPLVAGYVLLVALWLILFKSLPHSKSDFSHQYPALYSIGHSVGPVGIAAAVSLAAYLAGSIIVGLSSRVLQLQGAPIEATSSGPRQRLRRSFSFTHNVEMDELEERLKDLVERELNNIEDEQLRLRAREDATGYVGQSQVWFDFRRRRNAAPIQISPDERARIDAKSGRIDDRILAQNVELFNEISRSRSEAELRAGLIPTLTLLMVGLLMQISWSAWLKVIVSIGYLIFIFLLCMEILQMRSRFRGIAMRAVVDGLVTTPTIDLIRLRRERAEKLASLSGRPSEPTSGATSGDKASAGQED